MASSHSPSSVGHFQCASAHATSCTASGRGGTSASAMGVGGLSRATAVLFTSALLTSALLARGTGDSPCVQGTWSEADSSPSFPRYACVPMVAALTLQYFGREWDLASLRREVDLAGDGTATAAALMRVLAERGLFCDALQGLSPGRLRSLMCGRSAIVVTQGPRVSHAQCLFMTPSGLAVTDGLTPPKLVEPASVKAHLARGDICILVGLRPVRNSWQSRALWCAAGVIALFTSLGSVRSMYVRTHQSAADRRLRGPL